MRGVFSSLPPPHFRSIHGYRRTLFSCDYLDNRPMRWRICPTRGWGGGIRCGPISTGSKRYKIIYYYIVLHPKTGNINTRRYGNLFAYPFHRIHCSPSACPPTPRSLCGSSEHLLIRSHTMNKYMYRRTILIYRYK